MICGGVALPKCDFFKPLPESSSPGGPFPLLHFEQGGPEHVLDLFGHRAQILAARAHEVEVFPHGSTIPL